MQRQAGQSPWRRPVTAALLAAGLLAVVLAVVVPAQGTPSATIQQRVTALEKKVKTLQTNVATLQRTASDLTTAANALTTCLVTQGQGIPVALFGSTTEGYLYRLANGQQIVTTALDILGTTEVTDQTAFMLVTSRTCANAINGSRLPTTREARTAAPEFKLQRSTKR